VEALVQEIGVADVLDVGHAPVEDAEAEELDKADERVDGDARVPGVFLAEDVA